MSEESDLVKHYGSLKSNKKVQNAINNSQQNRSANNFETTFTVERNLVIFGRDLNMTWSQFTSASMLSVYFFLTWAYFSLFTPFFPGEALKKGQNRSQIGIIFGMLQLVLLLLSPIFGKYVSCI